MRGPIAITIQIKPLFRLVFYTDTSFSVPVGKYVRYKKSGKLFYEGQFISGVRAGVWYFYESGGKVDSVEYATLINNKSNAELPMPLPARSAPAAADTSVVFSAVEVESSFKGGDQGWVKYISKKLEDVPDQITDELKPGKYTTEVSFVVCTDGSVCNVMANSSAHPLFDPTAVNAIRKGPAWTPASQNQRAVKLYKKQKISVVIP